MQKILFTICLLSYMIASYITSAQVPQKISYQAVLRDNNNALIVNTTVGMKISLQYDYGYGTYSYYSETHQPTTNANGLVTIEIGTGAVYSGSFASIPWAGASIFIKTEIDPTGGSNYTIIGTQPLTSVPYALHAQTVANESDPQVSASTVNKVPKWNGTSLTDGSISDVNGVVGIGTNSPDGDVTLHLKNASTTSSTTLRIGNFVSGWFGFGYYTINNYADISCRLNQNNVYDRALQFWNKNPNALSSSQAYDFLNHSGSSICTILESGNVGIGNSSPSTKLDVNGNVRITDGTQGNGKVLTSDANGVATWQLPSLTASETDPQVGSVATNKIPKWNGTALVDGNITDSASNVGIGTTNPIAKLDVNGNIKIKDGTQGLGKVLTSDANGLATWLTTIENDPHVSSTDNNKIPKWNGTTLTDGTIVDSASNIGIGTTSPGAKLHVNGILRAQADPSNKAIEFYKSNGTQGWEMYVFNTGLSICEQGVACDRLVVAAGGNVGIGTSTPSQKFTVSNSTTTGTYTTSGWAHSSDARLKTNVKTLHNSLEKILKLNGVSYNWMKEPTSNPQVGFIAQDVEKVFPEIVVVDSNGNYSMVYQNLVAPMVEAIKEQQQQIEELIKQNKALARRIESLEK